MDLRKTLRTTTPYIQKLAESGYHTAKDLLLYFPRTYEDRSNIKTLEELVPDEVQTVKLKVIKKNIIRTRNGKQIQEVTLIDEHEVKVMIQYFRMSYDFKKIELLKRYYVIGKPTGSVGKVKFMHPQVILAPDDEDIASSGEVGRIFPIYSDMQGIKALRFAKKMFLLQPYIAELFTTDLPQTFLDKYNLPTIVDTISSLHFPESFEHQIAAQRRLFFLRLLRIQLHSLQAKLAYVATTIKHEPDRTYIKEFLATLPFTLTNAQKRCIKEMVDDIHSDKTMMRLLQWDVGSGKTIVAAAVAYHILRKNQWQTALLAPLEVLAVQHYRSLAKLFLPLGIKVQLLTWSLTAGEKTKIKKSLKAGQIDIIVGTHAIIQDSVEFDNLQLAIIDEQHKFWVRQRAFFKKFWSPHLLQMTATPIPRSLTLAFFGEFEVSVIDEMPAGRKPIQTKIVSNTEAKKLKPRVLTKIEQWQKMFLVTPLIEESEHMEDTASVLAEREETQAIYPELIWKIWLLHGKMKSADKDQVMKDFKSGKYMILVSTTVIEVGIDIPDATIMIIKNAERFGLSQLHQLRGRVWRNDMQSYCFLQTPRKSWETYQRLRHMEETMDWFKLAEIDLQIRGAGEMLGTRQSGQTDVPLEILTDTKFLHEVKEAWLRLTEHHPEYIPQVTGDETQERMGELLV